MAISRARSACFALALAGAPAGDGPRDEAPAPAETPAPPTTADTGTAEATGPADRGRGLPIDRCSTTEQFPVLLLTGRFGRGGPLLLDGCGLTHRRVGETWEALPARGWLRPAPSGLRFLQRLDGAAARLLDASFEPVGSSLPVEAKHWRWVAEELLCGQSGRTLVCVSPTANPADPPARSVPLPDGAELWQALAQGSSDDPLHAIVGATPPSSPVELPEPVANSDGSTSYLLPRASEPYVVRWDGDRPTRLPTPAGQLLDYSPAQRRWLMLRDLKYVVEQDGVSLLEVPASSRDGGMLSPTFSFDGIELCASIGGISSTFTSPCRSVPQTPGAQDGGGGADPGPPR